MAFETTYGKATQAIQTAGKMMSNTRDTLPPAIVRGWLIPLKMATKMAVAEYLSSVPEGEPADLDAVITIDLDQIPGSVVDDAFPRVVGEYIEHFWDFIDHTK